jgi:hypothetical protein
VVLVCHRVAQCKVVPVSMAEDPIALVRNLQKFVQFLKEYLDRASQAHKAFQMMQKRKDITVRDWSVPDVRVAFMQEISETESPYAYRHRFHGYFECGE